MARGLMSNAEWAFFEPFIRGYVPETVGREPITGGC
ncbi:hypothetical protein JSE7799_00134 [Jannaschia seosinensis]|uniref:Uncharacterized protein n=1 Tax=Jannaschia seosinensis TaxID=313367 RepID=A0A0M7B6J1_9RHOB|nr:hypothetical protein JSE7799_00134 [Jannaschia seosinensis]